MNKLISFCLSIAVLVGNEYYSDRLLLYVSNGTPDFILRRTPQGVQTGIADLDPLLRRFQVQELRHWLPHARPDDRDGEIFLNRFYVLSFRGERADIDLIRQTLAQVSSVGLVERIPILKPSYTPNDPRYPMQWHLPIIQAPEAWDMWDISGGEVPGLIDSGEIIVGVVDTGTEYWHPDLVGNIWNNLGEDADGDGVTLEQSGGSWVLDPGDINGVDDDGDGYIDDLIGWDTQSGSGNQEDNDPRPPNVGDVPEHGTLVAGTASSVSDNALGVASVGWAIKIMPVKIANDNNGSLTGGYDGILYAAQAGADVINCSWGGYGYSNGAQNVINVVHNQYGAIIVAAAGNGYNNQGPTNFDTHYPSGYDNVISVTATGPGDHFNCWATAGPTVDLSAPGEGIWTTMVTNGYSSATGTSFSSPLLAGAVGLLWSMFPDTSQAWIEDRIVNSTDYYSDMDRDCPVRNNSDASAHTESMSGMLGSGRLNIFKALAGGLYPSLTLQEVNLQGDTDGDGIFNPGETAGVKVILYNEEGWAMATNVVCLLSTTDPRITIDDNIIEFTNNIDPGTSAFTLFDAFTITAANDAATGPVVFTLTTYAGQDPFTITFEEEFTLNISLDQRYFPFNFNSNVVTSPIVYDTDGDGTSEIYFGSNNFNLYGIDEQGNILPGFPFASGNQVKSSVAMADLEGDGDMEIVFGSKDTKLYVLNTDGTVQMSYSAGGYIMATPALADLDGDKDLEIIFGTFENTGGSIGGQVYAIHHTGVDVDGFPVDVGAAIMAAPAVGDLDRDGNLDIVVGTWGNEVVAISNAGVVKSGFPYPTGNKVNAAPALGNLVGDGDLEIAAPCDDGILHVIGADGSTIKQLATGAFIRGAPALQDINGDGYPEIFFGGYDKNLHAYDLSADQSLPGWPISLGQNISSSPALADLDNDGEVEVVCAHFGRRIVAYHLDGTPVNNFPLVTSAASEASPAIVDLDNDGDFEILVGTSLGLEVKDVKTDKGSLPSWKVYRGSWKRTGVYEDALTGIDSQSIITSLPTDFWLSSNYPNPFNPITQFQYEIPTVTTVRFTIYNVLGQVIMKNSRQVTPGRYTFRWGGKDQRNQSVPTGVYFLRMETIDGTFTASRKLVLLK